MDIHPKAIENINSIAVTLTKQVQSINFSGPKNTGQKTNRLVVGTLTEDDIIGDIIYRDTTVDGEFAIAFLHDKGIVFGLKGAGIEQLDNLLSALVKIKNIATAVSDEYLEKAIFEWLRDCRKRDQEFNFWETLKSKLDEDIKPLAILIPLHGLEFDIESTYGGVSILNFDSQYFDEWEAKSLESDPDHEEAIKAHISKTRTSMQGYAAVKVNIMAEEEYAHQAAFEIANRVCSALRIFSPFRRSILSRPYFAPFGTTHYPIMHSFTVGTKEIISYQSAVVDTESIHWKIDEKYLEDMTEGGFGKVFELSIDGAKNKFQEFVWQSILAFSKSLLSINIQDRIAFRVSAIESMLLKDAKEQIASSVGDRMAFLLSDKLDVRREIVRNFKVVYAIRSDYVHHRKTRNEENELERFGSYSWSVLQQLIQNIDRYENKTRFIEEIDKKKYGG